MTASRVLLRVTLRDGSPLTLEQSRKAALLVARTTGVARADGGSDGLLNVEYDPHSVTVADLFRQLARATLRAGIA